MTLKSSLNNLQLQQMHMADKSMSLLDNMEDMKTERQMKESKNLYNELKTNQNIVDQMKKINYESLTPEERVAVQEGMRYYERKNAAKFLHLNDPTAAAFSPAEGENGKKVRDQNLQFSQTLLHDAGASADEVEYLGEFSANMQASVDGGEISGMSYDNIPTISSQIIQESVPGFEASELHTAPEDMEDRMKQFRQVAVNKFQKEFANDTELDAIGRVEGAIKGTLEAMNIDVEADPDTANALIQSGMEAVVQHRESQGTTNLASIDGLVGMNLVNTRDLLNKIGYESANVAPTAMIEKLQSSLGFRQLTVISEAAQVSGDDALLLSNLAAEVKRLNPLIDDDSVSEIERKTMVKKNFLDVVGATLEKSSSNVPPAQKIALVSMLEKIDADIDRGVVDPMVDSMLEHVYARFTEGYGNWREEERRVQRAAQAAGRGIIVDVTTGKNLQTADNFDEIEQRARTRSDQALSRHYNGKLQSITHGAGFSFVQSAADDGTGLLAISDHNKQFYLGHVGDDAIAPGLSAIVDGVVTDKPFEQYFPAMANPEAKAMMNKTLKNASLVSHLDDKYIGGLFMKAGPDNPIDEAGIKLEKFGDYYIPESVGKMFEENLTPEMANLKKASMKSPLGAKAVLATVMQGWAVQAQAAASQYNRELAHTVGREYPSATPDPLGYQRSTWRAVATDEVEHFNESVPRLSDGIPLYADGQTRRDFQNELIKYREGLEDRKNILRKAKKNADDLAHEDQIAMFSGTSAEKLGNEVDLSVQTLEELIDVINDIENLPAYSSYGGTAGMGRAGDVGTFRAKERRNEQTEKKRDELFSRLNETLSVMNQASL
jgi:hypothetical protein